MVNKEVLIQTLEEIAKIVNIDVSDLAIAKSVILDIDSAYVEYSAYFRSDDELIEICSAPTLEELKNESKLSAKDINEEFAQLVAGEGSDLQEVDRELEGIDDKEPVAAPRTVFSRPHDMRPSVKAPVRQEARPQQKPKPTNSSATATVQQTTQQ